MLQALLLQVTSVGMQPVSSTCSSQSSNPCSRPHRTPLPALRGPVVSQSRSRGHTPHCGTAVWRNEAEEVYTIVETRVGLDAIERIHYVSLRTTTHVHLSPSNPVLLDLPCTMLFTSRSMFYTQAT